jgi:hypothetical protein
VWGGKKLSAGADRGKRLPVSLGMVEADKEKTNMTERFAIHDEFFCAAFAGKERTPRSGSHMFWGGEAMVIEVEFDSYFRQRTDKLTSKIETKGTI